MLILARLAVSNHDQGRGIGSGLPRDAIRRTTLIAEQAGALAMLPPPIDEEAAHLYIRFGFIASPLREQRLLRHLKDAGRCLRRTLTIEALPAGPPQRRWQRCCRLRAGDATPIAADDGRKPCSGREGSLLRPDFKKEFG